MGPRAVVRRTCIHRVWAELMRRVSAIAVAAMVGLVPMHSQSVAEDDVLEKAINYLFTAKTDPSDGLEFVDRKSCAVLVSDRKNKRFAKYYLSRFHMDDSSIIKRYAGSHVLYQLEVRGDDTIVEYTNLDKTTVIQAYDSAQIPLPGTLEEIRKSIKIISSACKPENVKAPF